MKNLTIFDGIVDNLNDEFKYFQPPVATDPPSPRVQFLGHFASAQAANHSVGFTSYIFFGQILLFF